MFAIEGGSGLSPQQKTLYIGVEISDSCSVAITVLDIDSHSIWVAEFEDSKYFVMLEKILI